MKALEKDRTRRYETANALSRDIQRYLADEVVEARPPSAAYRLHKFARKNRKLLGSVAAFALLLIAGVVISTWQALRATAAERELAAQRDAREEAWRQAIANEQKAKEAAALEQKARLVEAAQRRQAEAVAEALESVLLGIKPNQSAKDFISQLQRPLARAFFVIQEAHEETSVAWPMHARLKAALQHADLVVGQLRKEGFTQPHETANTNGTKK
jgi:hypothetical protein